MEVEAWISSGCWRRVIFMFVWCAELGKGRLIDDDVTSLMNLMFCVMILIVVYWVFAIHWIIQDHR